MQIKYVCSYFFIINKQILEFKTNSGSLVQLFMCNKLLLLTSLSVKQIWSLFLSEF